MVALSPEDGIVCSFNDPLAANPYNVISIEGLDSGPISSKYYRGNFNDKFYDPVPSPRSIVFRLALNPDYGAPITISDLRDNVYKAVSMSRSGKLDIFFMNGADTVATISGFVQKIETNPFDKVPNVAITVECDYPVLTSVDQVDADTSGDLSDLTIIDNSSTAPHGVSFEVVLTGSMDYITLYDPTDSNWLFTIQPISGPILSGEILTFSNERGQKICTTNLRDLRKDINVGSIWPVIFPGENHLTFASSAPGTPFTLSYMRYKLTYWGV